MKKEEFFVEGTLGDAFIASCKLYYDENIRIYHRTAHKYWYPEIKEIYNIFLPTAEVYFTDENKKHLLEVNSNCHLQTEGMEFFPEHKSVLMFPDKKFIVLQVHSGKINGGNTKRLSFDTINNIINNYYPEIDVYLIGTDKYYFNSFDNCINHIGKTDIPHAFMLIYNSSGFIGPEGLMSFFALSQKKDSIIFYRDYEAVKKRIIGTPWEQYIIDLIRMDNIIY